MSAATPPPTSCPEPPENPPDVQDLVGLAFSGGGIRSASFNLGVLQGLAERNVLWMFDYLSTVSGGGFVGAWWSAWLSRVERRPPEIFPPGEELEPARQASTAVLLRSDEISPGAPVGPDGSRIARRDDPIHFLRLFSNYLTPKTGAFSPDTWRLVGFFVRNLIFTWIILLPILLAAVVASQAYFLSSEPSATAFLCEPDDVRTRSLAGPAPSDTAAPVGYCATPINLDVETSLRPEPGQRLAVTDSPTVIRWKHLARPMVLLTAAYATLAVLWLAYASIPVWLALVSLAAVIALIRTLVPSGGPSPDVTYHVLLPVVIVLVVAGHFLQAFTLLLRKRTNGEAGTVWASAADYRGILGKQQASLLRLIVLLGLLLVFSAFGHDVARILAFETSDWIARAGWVGVAVAIVSAAYTVIKALPTPHGTSGTAPSGLGTVLVAIAPPSAAIMLAIGFAWASHRLLQYSANQPRDVRLSSLAIVAAWMGVLQVCFALFESSKDPESPVAASTFWYRMVPASFARPTTQAADQRDEWMYLFSPGGWVRVSVLVTMVVLYYASADGLWMTVRTATLSRGVGTLAIAMLVAAVATTFARRTWPVALGSARPAVLLSIAAATALFILLAGEPRTTDSAGVFLVAPLWIVLLIGFVICTGWLADPNLLSLHGFYKGRLSRAYLGASNTARNNEEITDAAPGDDITLTELWNHDAGAPYHLVNTTLSLVGGSDLAMSQRSAENFVMSRYHCGSARASYRCTAEYMSGQLSLATAAAVSGAAISPNMGSATPSAALALFLSLFNVRLGFWAPTPSARRWREPHARLWPFYVLRETLSNTGQMGTYCYLTDGGHFDNTGLYALVERGCRFIVVCDCGADPDLRFADIGAAIRRCRIDFGTEIDLQIDPLAARQRNRTGKTHVVWGTIRYHKKHLEILALDQQRIDGVIVWIKPTVTATDAADVRQYQLENADFPQQSTANQWYDESQFESYRRLGFESALEAFEDVVDPRTPPLPVPGNFRTVAPWFAAHVRPAPAVP